MKTISSIWLILISFGYCHGQFAVLNPELIKSKGSPLSFSTGDFDGDGRKDIAYLSENPITLTVLYAESDNSYTENLLYTTPTDNSSNSAALAAGDINKDGKTDIILFDNVLNTTDKIISLISQGRTFEQSTIQTEGTNTFSGLINILDWDGDSNLDILVLCYSDPLQFYKGNGTGQFTRQTLSELGTGQNMEINDLNNDDKFDVIISNQNTLSIYLSNGVNYSKSDFTVSNFISEIEVGDLTNDGLKDILTINAIAGPTDNLILFENKGSNTFTQTKINTSGYFHKGLDIDDFNNDGRMDILIGAIYNNGINLLLNIGSLNFVPQTINRNYAGISYQVEFEDLDNNSSLEIIALSSSKKIDLFKLKSNQEYELYFTNITGFHATHAVVEDINKDGNLDIVTASLNNYTIVIHYGKADQSFENPTYYTSIGPITAVGLSDINDDGFPDIIYSSEIAFPGASGVIKSNGSGGFFTPQQFLPPFSGLNLVVGDLDNDGLDDILYGNSYLRANGDGSYSKKSFNSPIEPVNFTLGDINNDSYLDIAITDYVKVIYCLNDGTGNFPSYSTLKNTGQNHNISMADVDHDGKLDFVVPTNISEVSIYFAQSGGLFNQLTLTTSGYNIYNTVIADFNNDDKQDLAVGHDDGTIDFFIQQNNNQFSRTSIKSNGSNHLIVADLNNDSRNDLITFSLNGDPIGILYNDSVFEPSAPSNFVISNRTDKSATISLTKGNGNGRLILVREVGDPRAVPNDDTLYAANTTFGNGDQLGTRNYAVYRGSGQSVNVSGLKEDTEYIVTAFEYSSNNANTLISYEVSGTQAQFKTKKNQAIIVANINSKTIGDAPFQLTFSANSGLTVGVSVLTTNASLSNNMLTMNAQGPVILKFSQPGNDDYIPAIDVEITFCVNPVTPTISYGVALNGKFTLTSSSDTNNNWLRNGVEVNGANNKTFEPEQDGVYAVKVDFSGCSNTSAPTPYLITGVEKLINSVSLYPNPSNGNVIIEWPQQNARIIKITLQDAQGKNHELKYEKNDTHLHVNFIDSPVGIFVLSVYSDWGVLPLKVIKN